MRDRECTYNDQNMDPEEGPASIKTRVAFVYNWPTAIW